MEAPPSGVWLPCEEKYLQSLASSCQKLSIRYQKGTIFYRRIQWCLRCPVLICTALTSMFSFSLTPSSSQTTLSISSSQQALVMGILSLLASILSSLENFLQITETMQKCDTVQHQFNNLALELYHILALSPSNRPNNPAQYVKDAFSRYRQVQDVAPILSRFQTDSVDLGVDSPSLSGSHSSSNT